MRNYTRQFVLLFGALFPFLLPSPLFAGFIYLPTCVCGNLPLSSASDAIDQSGKDLTGSSGEKRAPSVVQDQLVSQMCKSMPEPAQSDLPLWVASEFGRQSGNDDSQPRTPTPSEGETSTTAPTPSSESNDQQAGWISRSASSMPQAEAGCGFHYAGFNSQFCDSQVFRPPRQRAE